MKKEIVKELSEEQLAILNQNYPVNDESDRVTYPRFGMLSKDITEESGTGKNKKIEVIQSAGTFYTEKDEGEINEETGKKIWTKRFLEDKEEVDVIIAFHRKQLRKFDSSLNKFISSPVYDSNEQVIPLYLDKQQIKRGTPAQLQALYPALTQKGKPTSDLKEETILYVIYEGELYQMNLSQSSKWDFKAYKKNLNPSTVVTTLGSVEETFGKNTFRKTTFTNSRSITPDEFELINEYQGGLKATVESDMRYYAQQALPSKEDKELDELAEKSVSQDALDKFN